MGVQGVELCSMRGAAILIRMGWSRVDVFWFVQGRLFSPLACSGAKLPVYGVAPIRDLSQEKRTGMYLWLSLNNSHSTDAEYGDSSENSKGDKYPVSDVILVLGLVVGYPMVSLWDTLLEL